MYVIQILMTTGGDTSVATERQHVTQITSILESSDEVKKYSVRDSQGRYQLKLEGDHRPKLVKWIYPRTNTKKRSNYDYGDDYEDDDYRNPK